MSCLNKLFAVLLLTGACLADGLSAAPLDAFGGLAGWKLTLPVDTPAKGVPDEIPESALPTFADARCFHLDGGGRLIFRARCDGVTTRGSKYPRSELREMDGSREAAWDVADAKIRGLDLVFAVTHLPEAKPHVVCAQIHDASRDVLMVRLEGSNLLLERTGREDVVLNRNYELGEPVILRIEAGAGRIRVWYQDVLRAEWAETAKGCYFKAGCYVQSNVAKGDRPDAYAEVRFTRIERR
jgi:poly(beta-D-mannuronate) lyase